MEIINNLIYDMNTPINIVMTACDSIDAINTPLVIKTMHSGNTATMANTFCASKIAEIIANVYAKFNAYGITAKQTGEFYGISLYAFHGSLMVSSLEGVVYTGTFVYYDDCITRDLTNVYDELNEIHDIIRVLDPTGVYFVTLPGFAVPHNNVIITTNNLFKDLISAIDHKYARNASMRQYLVDLLSMISAKILGDGNETKEYIFKKYRIIERDGE